MPVTESEFNPSQLWPPSNHNWMTPGAVRSTAAAYGEGLDLGALRVMNGIWEILFSRTPTPDNQSNSGWIPFEPSNPTQLQAANGFRRYGPGWSFGPGHNQHDEVVEYFRIVNGRVPTPMEKLDIEHDKGDYQSLLKEYQHITGIVIEEPGTEKPGPEQPKPKPGPQPQPGPTPTLSPLPPLSSPEQRAAEIMTMLPEFLRRPWLVPLVQEAVVIERRLIERVARRVAELLERG